MRKALGVGLAALALAAGGAASAQAASSWNAAYASAGAAGSYTGTRVTPDIYSVRVTGTLKVSGPGCYFVVAKGALGRGESARQCGPGALDISVGATTNLFRSFSVQVCRNTTSDCGPANYYRV